MELSLLVAEWPCRVWKGIELVKSRRVKGWRLRTEIVHVAVGVYREGFQLRVKLSNSSLELHDNIGLL